MSCDEAKRLVQEVEDAFGAGDLDRIAEGFTEDAAARFTDFPEKRGRAAIRSFLRARFARTRGYRLKKTLHVLMDDRLANTWDASWEDARTGKPMVGRGTGQETDGSAPLAGDRRFMTTCGTRYSCGAIQRP